MSPFALARRRRSLLPDGVPRYMRVYDNGGESADRYTVVFSGKTPVMRTPDGLAEYPFLTMSANPFSPSGIGLHCSTPNQPCDTIKSGKLGHYWPPAIGRKCWLGRRVEFHDLPADCQRLALQDYEAFWNIELPWIVGAEPATLAGAAKYFAILREPLQGRRFGRLRTIDWASREVAQCEVDLLNAAFVQQFDESRVAIRHAAPATYPVREHRAISLD